MSLLAALLSALLLAKGPADPRLATVNGEPVTGSDLREEFTRRHGGHQRFLAGETEVRRFLDLVIDRKLLIQEAYRLELQELPDIKTAAAERLDREAVAQLVEAEIDAKARPTPEEIRAAWEKNTNELIQVRQIVLDSPEKAAAIRERLVAGESFEALAREQSLAPSRVMGGRLPMVGWGTMSPAWEEAVFKLAPNELSPVIATPDGWEIVQFGSRSTLERPPLDKAYTRIEGILKKRKQERRKRAFSELLWAKYHARAADVDRSPAALTRLAQETAEAVVASWDGGSLSVGELMKELDMKELGSVLPARQPAEIDARLRVAVNAALARLEARARGLDKAHGPVEAARRYQEELMEGALYDGYVLKDVAVTDGEVRAYYDGHAAELMTPAKRRVSHIVVASLEEAQELRKRLDAGEPFEELARKHSTDATSAKNGGDLGWIGDKDVPPDFAPVLSLARGDVSPPLSSKFGYHLVRVTDTAPPQPLAFEAARDDIRKRLLQQKQRKRRTAWVEQLRATAAVKVHDAAVRAFVKQNDAEPLLAPPATPASHEAMQKPHARGGPPH